jgi:hypothetical protein
MATKKKKKRRKPLSEYTSLDLAGKTVDELMKIADEEIAERQKQRKKDGWS